MIPFERRNKILSSLQENGYVRIDMLTQQLGVSHMTVRRDLQSLEKEGIVSLVQGGAQITKKIFAEPSRQDKKNLYINEKASIGLKASILVSDGDCVYLDAGTTSLFLCKEIMNKKNLTIVTNDLVIVNQLINDKSDANIIFVGGQVRKDNFSTVGVLCTDIIKKIAIDIAFLSTASWDSRGMTTPDLDKAVVKQAVCDSSRKRVLIADSSKYGNFGIYVSVPMESLNMIITDSKLDIDVKKHLEAKGVFIDTV